MSGPTHDASTIRLDSINDGDQDRGYADAKVTLPGRLQLLPCLMTNVCSDLYVQCGVDDLDRYFNSKDFLPIKLA